MKFIFRHKKISFTIIIFFIIFLCVIFSMCIQKKICGQDFSNIKLPDQYKNYDILAQQAVDLNYHIFLEHPLKKELKANIVLINNTKDYPAYMGLSQIILLREDGYFLELPGYGEGFEWWQIGDLNGNEDLDVAVMYQHMGSGLYKPFYFYEWNGYNFEVKLHNSNLFNRVELIDVDDDGRSEIVHTFRLFQFAWPWKEIYEWQYDKTKGTYGYVKASNLFPASYEEWLKDKELNSNGSFETAPEFWETQDGKIVLDINKCLKQKAILNSQGIFADVDDCYLGY